jgi:hypothetical protein
MKRNLLTPLMSTRLRDCTLDLTHCTHPVGSALGKLADYFLGGGVLAQTEGGKNEIKLLVVAFFEVRARKEVPDLPQIRVRSRHGCRHMV